MKDIEYYLSKIDSYIIKAKTTDNPEKKEAFLRFSQEILDKLEAFTTEEKMFEIEDRREELNSILNQQKRFAKIKNLVKSHKLASILAGAITLSTIGGCTASFQNNDKPAVVEQVKASEDAEYDTERYSRNPLTGESLITGGTAFAESLAKNGAYDKEGYGPEVYALLAVLNTNGSMPGKDDFVKNIDLQDYFAEKGDLNKGINQIDELIEKVVRARGDLDWESIVPHKKSASMLEKAEKLYNDAGATPSSKQKEEWNKFINDEVIADLEQYSPFTIMALQHYITMATDAHLMTPEQRDLFYKDLDVMCNSKGEACGVEDEKAVGAEDTIYSSSKQIAVSYLESLLDDEKEHEHADGEVYYTFAEVTKGVKENIKDLKNADIDIEEKGKEEAIKNIDAITSKKYPGITVDENDPKINHSNGTYESGESLPPENQVGDSVDLPNTDANGNETDQSKEEMIDYSNQAAADFNNGQYKNQHLYDTQPSYKATWDAMKKAFDEYSKPAPGDDEIVDIEEDENEIYYPEKPATPEVEEPSAPVVEEPSTPEVDDPIVDIPQDDIISDDTTTEDIMDDDWVLGDDGYYYPKGQLPADVNPAALEEETVSKTR